MKGLEHASGVGIDAAQDSSTAPAGAAMEYPAEPGSARLILTLGLAGLLSGLAIVGAYEITLPVITENKARALEAAVLEVVPGSASMRKMVFAEGDLIDAPPADPKAAGTTISSEEVIYAAFDANEQLLGYAIPGEGTGFQDVIKLIYGYDPVQRRIVGMRILESRETPGLGDKIYKDAAFVGNFSALAVDPTIELVKGRTSPNQVDGITGATISSKAVVKILNLSNQRWIARLPQRQGDDG